jgi:YjjG family noncanonical pyrimidine nucleotidase
MRYKWLLLDADGTLFDYDRAETKALELTFDQSGYELQKDHVEIYRQVNGQLWLDFEQGEVTQDHIKVYRFERLFEEMGITLDADAFSERYLENLGQFADLIEGAEEVVRSLYGEIEMVLITNGLAAVQRSRLARSPLEKYLTDLVISEEVGVSKPDAKIFDVAFEKMGHPKREDVLIVGDSLTSDIRGGIDYGIDTCWFNPHGRSRDGIAVRYEIRRLEELVGIVRGA